MGKTYKVSADTFELTNKRTSKGNSRKVIARNRVQERRRERQKEKELYGQYYFTQQDME